MSEQPPTDPKQNLNISDSSSLEDVQIGGIAGRDLNVNQIQGQVVNVTIYDRINAPDGLNQQYIRKTKSLTHEEYFWRRVLLDRVKNFWIKGFLTNSLHIKALIELGLEKRLDLVQRSFSEMEEFPEKFRQLIPENQETIDVFNQMGVGRTLLILGEPGAGKTITLLKLAESLIARTETNLSLPIPIVFNLSSWANKKQAISEWLIQELLEKYNVSKSLGKVWVEEQQLLLLLDGLDEVKAEHRNACVRALNKFMQTHGVTEMVVCSRIQDYENLSERLKLQSAICIQPLTSEQIYLYLKEVGEQFTALTTLLEQNPRLLKLARSPLMLSIMSIAYQGCSLKDLGSISSTEEWQTRLFDNYIERMFSRKKSTQRYSKEQTRQWLIWLAQRMSDQKLTVFLIEQMQPCWIKTNFQRLTYRITIILLSGTCIGIIFGIISRAFDPLAISIPVGVIIGSITGLFWGFFRNSIVPSDSLSFSSKRAVKHLFWGLIIGILGGIILSIIYSILTGYSIKFWILQGWFFGLISGPIFGLVISLGGSTIEKKQPVPNQGIWRSLRNAFFLGLIGLVVLQLIDNTLPILATFIYRMRIDSLFIPFGIPISARIAAGISFGLYGTGEACIKHFILRLFLYFSNCIPWHYAGFLDYATERIFMQKVGGGYIFIHRMLLEHFANMRLEKEKI